MVSASAAVQTYQQRPSMGWKPLRAVIAWELRRMIANPALQLTVLGVFVLFALVMASEAHPRPSTWGFGDGIVSLQADIPYGSAMDVYFDLPQDFILPLVLVVVFAVTDGVARDWHRRTHELLMATEVPTWAYVLGRYFVAVAFSLFIALDLLLAILLVIEIEHVSNGGPNFPALQPGPVIATWAVLVLPATILAGGLGFALGTLLFRATTFVKLAIALAWVIVLTTGPALMSAPHVAQWIVRWDPTYGAQVRSGFGSYDVYGFAVQSKVAPLEASGQTISQGQLLAIFHHLVYTVPDVGTWLPPHLVWAAVAVALVAVAALTFQRYRTAA